MQDYSDPNFYNLLFNRPQQQQASSWTSLFPTAQVAPVSRGPSIADFAQLLNPQRHDAGWGSTAPDPNNPFNNGFFKTADQRAQVEQSRGLPDYYGKTRQTQQPLFLPSPATLVPGTGVNVPYSTANPGAMVPGTATHVPLMDFGQILNPRQQGMSPGIFMNGQPVQSFLNKRYPF